MGEEAGYAIHTRTCIILDCPLSLWIAHRRWFNERIWADEVCLSFVLACPLLPPMCPLSHRLFLSVTLATMILPETYGSALETYPLLSTPRFAIIMKLVSTCIALPEMVRDLRREFRSDVKRTLHTRRCNAYAQQ